MSQKMENNSNVNFTDEFGIGLNNDEDIFPTVVANQNMCDENNWQQNCDEGSSVYQDQTESTVTMTNNNNSFDSSIINDQLPNNNVIIYDVRSNDSSSVHDFSVPDIDENLNIAGNSNSDSIGINSNQQIVASCEQNASNANYFTYMDATTANTGDSDQFYFQNNARNGNINNYNRNNTNNNSSRISVNSMIVNGNIIDPDLMTTAYEFSGSTSAGVSNDFIINRANSECSDDSTLLDIFENSNNLNQNNSNIQNIINGNNTNDYWSSVLEPSTATNYFDSHDGNMLRSLQYYANTAIQNPFPQYAFNPILGSQQHPMPTQHSINPDHNPIPFAHLFDTTHANIHHNNFIKLKKKRTRKHHDIVDVTVQGAGSSPSQITSPIISGLRHDEIPQCSNCGVRETPAWRRDLQGVALLCNACGLYLKNKGVQRPTEIAPDGTIRLMRGQRRDSDVTCQNCGARNTPCWRTPNGQSLCGKPRKSPIQTFAPY
ncbi:7895_t:CDS:2 [Ambispora gerdemannii]|uniref:7895_t:CDS:1 n=1 Tax=Ambispora gerdemannii TaxID=144530 RepID=A0A9N9CRQ2_9GLOM|nr:7895_t:CDS:2 [Ambispora gerdemannii]